MRLFRLIALLAALLGFYLPWVANPAAALTYNAWDLAEQVGLSPAVRYTDPPMVAPFLLRAVLAALSLLFALATRNLRPRLLAVLSGGLALVLALTLLPPLEFFRGATQDPNYVQLISLCIATFIGLAATLALRGVLRTRVTASVALIGAAFAIAGQTLAAQTIRALGVPAPIGVGFFVTLIGLGIAAVLSLRA